jgi:hypothetical protein
MIRQGRRCRALALMLPVSLCLLLSRTTTAVALTATPSATQHGAMTPTPTFTPTPMPTACETFPPPTLTFGFSAAPAHPVVGDQVQLSFSVSGRGGLPSYSLSGATPIFQGNTTVATNQLGDVTFHLTAVQAGVATLTLNVNYETSVGCVSQPIFQFVFDTSPPFIVEVAESTTMPTATPTLTPTCAPTGTPYCTTECIPCPTIRPNCYSGGSCGLCIQNPACGSNEACVPTNNPNISGCCACATVTPTPPPLPTATATRTPPPSSCIGDCDGDGAVSIDELILGVNIALGAADFSACPAFDCSSDCHPGPGPATPVPAVHVACLIRAVNNALSVCSPTCFSDADCDDGNGCTADHCTPQGCLHDCLCDSPPRFALPRPPLGLGSRHARDAGAVRAAAADAAQCPTGGDCGAGASDGNRVV